ncbi:MAG: cupin domain-containing protein [Nitrospira sp.]
MRLPKELEEQAMLHALGILDPDDSRAFMMKLQEESDQVRQVVTAYQAVIYAMASVVTPVLPPGSLRERLINQVTREAAREVEQFELTADTVAFNAPPVRPPDSLRERLMSRIEWQADVQLGLSDSAYNLRNIQAVGSHAHRFSAAWRHLFVTMYTSLQLCWKAFVNLLRTMLVPSVTSDRSRLSKRKIASQRLTFIKASEGAWWTLAPGVTAKVLSFDQTFRKTTSILRFAPETSYAPHRHTEVEELYVLEGGCRIAGRDMTVGDYHRAETGTEHYETSSDEGCLLLVISSPRNEMLG